MDFSKSIYYLDHFIALILLGFMAKQMVLINVVNAIEQI